MSNSTQFKAGDKAIVLPVKLSGTTEITECRGHFLQPFSIATIDSVIKDVVNCTGIDYISGDARPYLQCLYDYQLQPLPIPYYLLDAE